MYAWEGIGPDRTPNATRRSVLAVLAKGPCRRLAIQREVTGSEFEGTYHVIDALRWLRVHRLAQRSQGAWRITPAGRAALDLDFLLEGGAA